MEKRKLLQAIEKTQQITEVSLRELREMLSEFPYFQTGYLLMAQQAELNPADANTGLLAKCATYAGNREHLYKLMADTRQAQADSAAATDEDALALQDNTPPQADDSLSAILPPQELNPPEAGKEINPDNEDAIHLNLTNKRNLTLLPDDDEDTDATTLVPRTDNDDWLEKVKVHALDYADLETEEISLDTISIEEEARKQVERELQKSLDYSEREAEIIADIDIDSESPPKQMPETEEETKLSIENEALQLIERDIDALAEEGALDHMQNFEGSANNGENDLIRNLKKRLEAYRQQKQTPYEQWLEKQTEKTTPDIENPVSKTDNETKLDNPLPEITQEEEPTPLMPPPKIIASEEPDDNIFTLEDSYITETMAKICVRQENYAKAIAIYERLSLKFPEKKAYFAAKIEELNNKLT